MDQDSDFSLFTPKKIFEKQRLISNKMCLNNFLTNEICMIVQEVLTHFIW